MLPQKMSVMNTDKSTFVKDKIMHKSPNVPKSLQKDKNGSRNQHCMYCVNCVDVLDAVGR
jgi:polyferredoxin